MLCFDEAVNSFYTYPTEDVAWIVLLFRICALTFQQTWLVFSASYFCHFCSAWVCSENCPERQLQDKYGAHMLHLFISCIRDPNVIPALATLACLPASRFGHLEAICLLFIWSAWNTEMVRFLRQSYCCLDGQFVFQANFCSKWFLFKVISEVHCFIWTLARGKKTSR